MFSKIVVPVDLDQIEQSRQALATARINLAVGGHLTLLHVLTHVPAIVAARIDSDIFDAARLEAQRLLEDLKKSENLPDDTDILVEVGQPYRTILEHIDNPSSQAIVMAAHNPGARNFFLGSVAAQVVRHARCSVFILRKPTS